MPKHNSPVMRATLKPPFKADVLIEIKYNINNPDETIIKTNAKKNALMEIFDAWLHGQIGQGKDESKPNKKNTYNIKITLDLSGDIFRASSDTGNKGLTYGIVMDVSRRLKNLKIISL